MDTCLYAATVANMSTPTKHPRRLAHVALRCARCRDRGAALPNVLAIVDYLDTRTVVATARRDGSRVAQVNSPQRGRRTRFHSIDTGKGAELLCPDCRAKPRRSRKVLLHLADEARAAGRDVCYVGD